MMNLEQDILTKLHSLPLDKQQAVLNFVEFMGEKQGYSATPQQTPRRSSEGIFAHLGIHITKEDIAEARREMWGNFAKEGGQ